MRSIIGIMVSKSHCCIVSDAAKGGEKKERRKQEKKRKLAFRKGYLLFPCSTASVHVVRLSVPPSLVRKPRSLRELGDDHLSVRLSLSLQFPQRKQTQQEIVIFSL
jgi:hypothetical protein